MTYFVHTLNNKFILKVYSTTTKTSQIKYEHSLLSFLQKANLSFAIPAPIPASSNETLVDVKTEQRSLRCALLPLLSGQPAARRNHMQVKSIGSALAELHLTLAKFDPDGQLATLPYWGNLTQIHPLVNNPLDIVQILNLNVEKRIAFNQMMTETMEITPYLYANLPIQTIHADYITPNILTNGDLVTGILDFEFATRDLRLLDYLGSLNQLALFPWKEEFFAEIVKAFSKGYQKYNSLTPAEYDAIIFVWRLQRASALIYWVGWLIEGKTSREKVIDSVNETLRFETWIENNKKYFLNCLNFR